MHMECIPQRISRHFVLHTKAEAEMNMKQMKYTDIITVVGFLTPGPLPTGKKWDLYPRVLLLGTPSISHKILLLSS